MTGLDFLSNLQMDCAYRLLELTPEMVEQLKQHKLTFKAPAFSSDLVLCTESKTYKVRQVNQTNTLLLTDNSQQNSLTAFGSVESIFQLEDTDPILDLDGVPRYAGGVLSESAKTESLVELRSRCAMSDTQFDREWRANCGAQINNVACIIDSNTIHSTLSDILISSVAARLDLNGLKTAEVYNEMDTNDDVPIEIVDSVLKRFSETEERKLAARYID
jgi:sister chromatid cohesion protein DCC1